jgi:hypothetical protein
VSNPSDGCGFSGIRLRMSDLEAAISGLDANKGPGNDGVPPSFIKLCTDGLKSPLLHIIYLSLSTGTFPPKWKDSFFIPSSKAGKRNDVGNYRDVAIICEIIRDHSIYDYIFFRSNLLICLLNMGFLRLTNLIELTSYVLNCMENGVPVDAIYTDFSKTFDV